MTYELPARIELDNGDVLRFFAVSDAEAVARAVGESLEHLRPWMPWADAQSTDPDFQRERIRTLPDRGARGEEWQYGLFSDDESQVLGSFGLMTRRGPRTIEIGYWTHVRAGGRGRATNAVSVLTDVAFTRDNIDRVLICCDEANTRSAAIPQRLGFTLLHVQKRRPEASGELGRLMTWAITREARATGTTFQ